MIQLILDTYKDRRNAYWFQSGPRGSIGDAIISENGAAFNKAWNGLERYLYSFSGHAKHLERQGGMKDIHHSNWHISKNEIKIQYLIYGEEEVIDRLYKQVQ